LAWFLVIGLSIYLHIHLSVHQFIGASIASSQRLFPHKAPHLALSWEENARQGAVLID